MKDFGTQYSADFPKRREEEKEEERNEMLKAYKALQEIPDILRDILKAIGTKRRN